jgi:hypothetical protein
MGRLTSTRTRRRLLRVIAASVLVIGALATWALAAGPGVEAIALSGGKVYAGGTFQDAGGHADADFLAVWDGSWKPFCNDPKPGSAIGANVTSLQIIDHTLYVGGSFQDGAHIASADYLLACDLVSGAPADTVADPAHPFAGSVYALTADSNGTLYAAGGFTNLENVDAADNVAYLPAAGGAWQPMGAGPAPCGCAVTTFARGLTAIGTKRSRSSIASSTWRGTSPAPAAIPRRTPSPRSRSRSRSRSRRSSPTRRPR